MGSLKAKRNSGMDDDAKFGMYTHWGIYSVPAHGAQITLKNCMRQTEKIERC